MSIQGKPQGYSAFSAGGHGSSPTVLTRAGMEIAPPALSSIQGQVDQLVTDFFKHATDWKALAAMTAGGLAYRAGRMGIMSLPALQNAPLIAQPLSVGLGLGAEVSAFEFTHRFLHTIRATGQSPLQENPNLWSLSGVGGWKEGFLTSLVTFGTLKGFGKLGQGQNLILRHGVQDAGMVLGHQLVYQAGIGPRPDGTLAERLLKAEVMNLQLSAGMALGTGLAPGLIPSPSPTEWGAPRRIFEGKKDTGVFSLLGPFGRPAWVGNHGPKELLTPVSMMSEMGPGGSGGGKKGGVPPPVTGGAGTTSVLSKDPLIGQIVDGRYKVEAVIGSGGMGIVYRCIHTKLGTPVAMKVLRTSQLGNPDNTERFKNEARAASAIGSPHIIVIKDIGQLENGSTYFVMEHLEGVPLSNLMEGDKPVPVPRLMPIARQIAVGLKAAHQKDIVHRDLKPGNIHLVHAGTEKEFVKILDFGIAKVLNSDRKDLTLMGDLLGTPRYMSPEQARGDPVDHRSDIYSYGVLLYKMATGKVPFDSNNILTLLEAHKAKPPMPIRDLSPPPQEVPPLLEAIILRCLEKLPAKRYQSMDEVIADLDQLSAQGGEMPFPLVKPGATRLSDDTTEIDAGFVPPQGSPGKKTPVRQITKVPPPVESDGKGPSQKSRWPLFLALSGLGGGSILIAALFASGKLKFPSSDSPSPPSPPTPQPPSPPSPAPTPPSPPPTPGPQDAGAPDAAPDAGETPVPDAAPSVPVPPPAPTLKKVEITVDPADAHVFLGAQELEKPHVIEIEPGKTVTLEIRREGFKTKTITIDESKDKVTIHLEKEIKKTPKPPKPPYPPPFEEEKPDPPYKDFEE